MDADGNYSVVFTPVQTTGTGKLTGAAWITDLDIVEDQGRTLRILKPNASFRFDETDALVDKTLVSLAVSSSNSWTEGAVSGGAPIVAEEVANTTEVDFSVDLEWTCGTVGLSGTRTMSQGYLLDSAGLDCATSWPQKFTIRPVPYSSPKYLRLERYGHVEDWEDIPLTSGPGGYSFDYARGRYRLRGVLASFSANGASLTLQEASYQGTNFCDPGSYSLSVEQ